MSQSLMARPRGVALFAVACALFVPAALATDTTCTGVEVDSVGYQCLSPAASLPNLAADGSAVTIAWGNRQCNSAFPGGDDCYNQKALNTAFSFYGTSYSDVFISSNGYVTFGEGYTDSVPSRVIPSASVPNAAVYAYGDDLYDDGSATTYYRADADCGVGLGGTCAAVQWNNLAILDADGVEIGRVTVRLALVYATNRAHVEIVSENAPGFAATVPQIVGIENATGTAGLWYQNPTSASDSGAATTGLFVTFQGVPPAVNSTVPANNAVNVLPTQNVIVTFNHAMDTSTVSIWVNGDDNPAGWTAAWTNGDKTVTWTHPALSQGVSYAMEVRGTDTLDSTLADSDGAGSCEQYCWSFTTADITAPAAVQNINTLGADGSVTVELVPPAADFRGYLVVRRAGSPVQGTPTNGVDYTVGDVVSGTSRVVAEVVDLTPDPFYAWTDISVVNESLYYYKVYPFDAARNYGTGTEIVGYPRESPPVKWTYGTTAAALGAVGLGGDANGNTEYVVTAGNDQVLNRMDWEDGSRVSSAGTWELPSIGADVQARPMVGDPTTGGVSQGVHAYMSAQNGTLYRFALEPDGNADVLSQDVTTDAGCDPGSLLQAGPVVMIHAINAGLDNVADDVVIQATRCVGTTATSNKVMAYTHALDGNGGSGWVLYDGGGALGISNASPVIFYRKTPTPANNLVYVPLTNDPSSRGLVVLEVDDAGGIPSLANGVPYATIDTVGNVDATPALFRKGNDTLLAIGNAQGHIYVYDAQVRDAPGVLHFYGSWLSTAGPGGEYAYDGPVKGISVSPQIHAGGGLYTQWITWTTDNRIHAVRTLPNSGDLDASTYRSREMLAASTPLTVNYTNSGVGPWVYVGSSNGYGYELSLNSATLEPNASFRLSLTGTVGDPTFDVGDLTNQGVIFGTTDGLVLYVTR